MQHLSAKQKQNFESDGFLVLPDFIEQAQCEELIREANRLVDEFDPGETVNLFSTKEQEKLSNQYFLDSGRNVSFFFEAGAFTPNGQLRQAKSLSINKIGHALHALNPVFQKFSANPELHTICQDLELTDPDLIQSMYIFKQPRIGGEVVCHQDATFLYTEPVSVLGFWFALQDAHTQNGCLSVLPGGHRLGLKRRFVRTPQNEVKFQELDRSPWPETGYVPLEAKKGSLVLLHGLLPHLSGPNHSDESRHAYSLHTISKSAHYPADNWLL
jgi:phytanoyl-CoA hydroxylase